MKRQHTRVHWSFYALAVVTGLVWLLAGLATLAMAQDVKYCKNAITGEIITIQAGYPCPYPTHEL